MEPDTALGKRRRSSRITQKSQKTSNMAMVPEIMNSSNVSNVAMAPAMAPAILNSSNHTLRNVVRNMNSKLANFKIDVNSIEQEYNHLNSNLNLTKNFPDFGESNANFTSRKQTENHEKMLHYIKNKLEDPTIHNKGELLQKLIHEHGFDPRYDDNEVLKIAIQNNVLDIVLALLADPRIVPDNAMLYIAIEHNSPDVVRALLTDPRVDPTADHNIALRMAVTNGNVAVVDILLQDPRVDPSIYPFNYMYSPIFLAASNGHAGILDRLLHDPRIYANPHIVRILALIFEEATSKGHIAVARRLLQDPRIDIVNGYYEPLPSLKLACEYGQVVMVDFLLKQLLKPEYANKFTKKTFESIINIVRKIMRHKKIPYTKNLAYIEENFKHILTLLKDFKKSYTFAPVGGRRRTQKKHKR